MSRLFTVIALLTGLATAARAETVDWSQYIDKNPSQPIAASSQASPAAKAASAKSTARPAKVATKVRPKARAKTKARHK